MKNLFLSVFLLVSTLVFGQDSTMLAYINQYRVSNGKSPLTYKSTLSSVATTRNNLNVSNDTLIHTNIVGTIAVGEIITKGNSLPQTFDDKLKFSEFLKTNFNIKYREPKSDVDAINYVKLYILYMYNQSKPHKAILLGKFTNVGFDIVIKNVRQKPRLEKIMVGRKTYEHKNIFDCYLADFYSVMDFN